MPPIANSRIAIEIPLNCAGVRTLHYTCDPEGRHFANPWVDRFSLFKARKCGQRQNNPAISAGFYCHIFQACRDGFSLPYKRTTELFRELAVTHIDGRIGRVLLKLSRVDVLVLDDFAMAPLKDSERRDFLEICDDRYQRRSLILTSQMPIAHWHEQIGDPTIADSILDRLVHNAYRIELSGESMRKKRGDKPER